MISPILWKEWREQRWKLAFGTLMLVFFTCSFLAAQVTSDQEVAAIIWLFGGLILALHSAMGVFAPERANGTMSFLASKPIEPWKVFACKWLFGWLNVAGPMLACTLALILFRPGDTAMTGHRTQMVIMVIRVAIGGLGLATMFYTMTCCLAPRKAGEAAVGLVGLLVFVAFMLHMLVVKVIVMEPMYRDNGASLLGMVLVYVNPFAWIRLTSNPQFGSHITMIFVQMILFVLVVWIGLRKWQRSV